MEQLTPHEIMKTWEAPVIPLDVLVEYVSNRIEQYDNEANADFPNVRRLRAAQANVHRNILTYLKQGGGSNGQSLQCENCNTLFVPKSNKAKFCSPKCRVSFFRKKSS